MGRDCQPDICYAITRVFYGSNFGGKLVKNGIPHLHSFLWHSTADWRIAMLIEYMMCLLLMTEYIRQKFYELGLSNPRVYKARL